MNVHEYAKSQNLQVFEVFQLAYRWKYGKDCEDGSLVKQSDRYRLHGVLPWFVGDYMRFIHKQLVTMPKMQQLSLPLGDDYVL